MASLNLSKVFGKQGILVILGSAMHWSWFDALFMSAFFSLGSAGATMSEIATVLVFAGCIPACLACMRRPALTQELVRNRASVMLFALLGTVGSVLFAVAGVTGSWPLLVLGGLLAGTYMAFTQISWCAAYAHEGARTATPLLAGAFACAIVFDAIALVMVPVASVILFALLPVGSGLLFLLLDESWKLYPRTTSGYATTPTPSTPLHPSDQTSHPAIPSILTGMGSPSHNPSKHLGVSLTLVSALVIVFVGFGYIQHMISFGGAPGTTTANGILIQSIRGVVAILLFAALVFTKWNQAVVYRVGLLLMIAGCLIMPFVLGSESIWLSGALIIAGFTGFDILIYVVFCEVAYASASPVKTIIVMRVFTCIGYCVGATAALLLSGSGAHPSPLYAQEATLVGFLLTIATVLMLSGEDFWVVLGMPGYRLPPAAPAQPDEKTLQVSDLLSQKLAPYGLTAREDEIVRHLSAGRTQAWIAQNLGISENTVGTHVRHIYQKTGAHNRSEFIDMVATLTGAGGTPSPEPRDCAG